MNDYKYEITVLVATYNSDYTKIIKTLNSIIMQSGIQLQIIISDDGSENFDYQLIKGWLQNQGFRDYKILLNEQNTGTVNNIYRGLNACDGYLVKLISPGDCLSSEKCLRKWYDFFLNNQADWSFSRVVYYHIHLGKMELVKNLMHPVFLWPYRQQNDSLCRWFYLIGEDNCIGAATLCKTDLLKQYLKQILNKVKYAEDNVYRLMMLDKKRCVYYEEDAILYETGSGISTSKSEIWKKRISEDWNATSQIIQAGCDLEDDFEKEVYKYLEQKNNSKHKKINIKKILGKKVFKSYTTTKKKMEFINIIEKGEINGY